jgi:hypothetical protein
MHHIQFCLEEILAEIDAALEQNGIVRALVQLDQREAEHDLVTAVDGADLREHLSRRIDGLALKRARNAIVEAKDLVAGALRVGAPKAAKGNVIGLAPDGGSSNPDEAAKAANPVPVTPLVRAAPHFKTMQERLAQAVESGPQRRAQPRRA